MPLPLMCPAQLQKLSRQRKSARDTSLILLLETLSLRDFNVQVSKGLTPYVDFCGSTYLVAQNLTRHDDSIYLVVGNMTYD